MERKRPYKFLTEVELEFMTVLWRLEEATVRDVLGNLAPHRRLAYTSAATILKILEEKGFATSRKDGRTFLYKPNISKDTYQSESLKDISEKLFNNTPAALVARLVEDDELSDDVLVEIRRLLDQRLGK